jgi:DNA-binding transcriptional MerR regulator
MATHHPIRKVVAPPAPVIPDKLYFRIGDVARLCEVPAYVLRFWETEFPNLKPNKGGTGQRLYRRKDVETALRIKHLLYDLGYTIPGARQVFKSDAASKTEASAPAFAPSNTETPTEAVILSEARSAQSRNTDALSTATNLSSFPTAEPKLARLHALREDLRALHTQLSSPVSDKPAADRIAAVPPPKPLRPRLVLEPRTKLELKPEPKLGPIALPGQQDLFPAD